MRPMMEGTERRKGVSDEITSEVGPSCKEAIVNSFAEGGFCGELGGGMKERCQGRKKGLVKGDVGLVQL